MKKSKLEEMDVFEIDSGFPGPRIAILSGIHGDEKAGVDVVFSMKDNLKITKGSVVFVIANKPALKEGVRFINKNLNRSLVREGKIKVYEDQVAHSLMNILDQCDAMLDLHAFTDAKSPPFLVGQKNSFEVSKYLPFTRIVAGLHFLAKGSTDGYMYEQGKVGICAELGVKTDVDACFEKGAATVQSFLQYYGLIEGSPSAIVQEKIIAKEMIVKKSENFEFLCNVASFQKVSAGEPIAKDSETVISFEKEVMILFPNAGASRGSEAFVLCEVL
jgi:predicted deacylase